jgi:CHAT domain-containing protein
MPRTLLSLTLAIPLFTALTPLATAQQPTKEQAAARYHKANELRDAADYAAAEKLYHEVLGETRQLFGMDSVEEAYVLNNLAVLYSYTRRDEQAESLDQRALAIIEARQGKEHSDTATSLIILANLYLSTGRSDQAEPHYKRALEIYEAKLGKDHPFTANVLTSLAQVYSSLGRYKEAEPLLKRGLEIYEAKLGKDHPETANSLTALANLYLSTGRDKEAEPLYKRALEIYEAKLGKDHPVAANVLTGLANFYYSNGGYEQAAAFTDRARRAIQRHVARVLPVLGEHEQLVYLSRTDMARFHCALSLALAQPGEGSFPARSAGWLLNAKGLIEQTRAQAILAARDSRDPGLAQDLRQLADVRQQLARLSPGALQGGVAATAGQRLDELTTQEAELVTRLSRAGAAVPIPDWVEVARLQDALPADAVFIDLARFDVFEPKTGRQPARYAAWITPKKGPTRLIDLGAAKDIDDAIADVRHVLEKASATLKEQGEPRAEKAVREPLAQLAKLVLEPLRKEIDGTKRWVISPDGDLWLVPWAALPLDEKTFVIEKHTLQLVVSGRDLLARNPVPGKTTAPAIFADPDFDGAPGLLPGAARALPGDLKLGQIPRLPGTAAEADAVADKIAKVFGGAPTVLTEGKATRAAFLALNRPRALLLATHGFFEPLQFVFVPPNLNAGPMKPVIMDRLFRCGLLLAGCNKPGEAGQAGVLTGRDVLSADLRGCELVVLSACQTALGDIHNNGEGVVGLRQAFQLAGAESVLASLWQVPDDETTLQMTAFMDALSKGKDRVEALALAQRQRISQRREKFGAAHPFNWAAFTLTGASGGQR